ncbi:mandelate racemase/muconate lactonizing enzyme family protein [Devosia naphthalenivorans]|uniref:mandelate racemase/muconate lactonizing enzyme family protein n=1 Tax=Devosia naphthalenivorans TaxID=2082392 RepID=UPI000D3BBF78|nr:mandelate racemase/muconate lactonizing enzyme family protein [Devosia naphthalenivorans]
MKIVEITTEEYRWPRKKPITNGLHTYTDVEFAIVRIKTDEGVEGIGLGSGGAIWRSTIERMVPLLIGEDPVNTERLWNKMWVPKLIGRRGLTTRAISSIDIGLWDLRAKLANMPLFKLLGGFRDAVPTYVAGGYYEEGKGLKELALEMEENVNMGARAIKMKVGAVPIAEDVERVRIVRDAIGPDVKLLVDANCAYRWYTAVQFARRIEQYDIFWFEEPVQPDDYDGHRKLAAATVIPIATGENEYTRYGFRDLIRHDAAAIFNADAKVLGGVTEFMKVAALAQANDLDIAPHGSQDIHVHLVAAISNGLILEFYGESFDPMWGRIYKETLRLNKDGTVSPPATPGIGVDLNYDALREYRVA